MVKLWFLWPNIYLRCLSVDFTPFYKNLRFLFRKKERELETGFLSSNLFLTNIQVPSTNLKCFLFRSKIKSNRSPLHNLCEPYVYYTLKANMSRKKRLMLQICMTKINSLDRNNFRSRHWILVKTYRRELVVFLSN